MGTASFLKRVRALLRVQNQLARECLAELLAVFVLVLITLGSSAQMITSSGTKGNILAAYLAGALAVTVAIYTAGGVSGAHLNPAFSLAVCLVGRFPWWKFPIFVAVQTSGAFISAGAVHTLSYDSNGTLAASGPQETASIFATYPADNLSFSNGFLDQVMGTALLIVGILAVLDTRSNSVPKGLEPVAVALLVFSVEVSMGSNCSCPMNPARDFGPQLFTNVAGWGEEVFKWVEGRGPGEGWWGDPRPLCPVPGRGNGWWWAPVVARLLGATLGSALSPSWGRTAKPGPSRAPWSSSTPPCVPPAPEGSPAEKDVRPPPAISVHHSASAADVGCLASSAAGSDPQPLGGAEPARPGPHHFRRRPAPPRPWGAEAAAAARQRERGRSGPGTGPRPRPRPRPRPPAPHGLRGRGPWSGARPAGPQVSGAGAR
ncbi:aquaporin-10 [Chlamydotis macqueenii]